MGEDQAFEGAERPVGVLASDQGLDRDAIDRPGDGGRQVLGIERALRRQLLADLAGLFGHVRHELVRHGSQPLQDRRVAHANRVHVEHQPEKLGSLAALRLGRVETGGDPLQRVRQVVDGGQPFGAAQHTQSG